MAAIYIHGKVTRIQVHPLPTSCVIMSFSFVTEENWGIGTGVVDKYRSVYMPITLPVLAQTGPEEESR